MIQDVEPCKRRRIFRTPEEGETYQGAGRKTTEQMPSGNFGERRPQCAVIFPDFHDIKMADHRDFPALSTVCLREKRNVVKCI